MRYAGPEMLFFRRYGRIVWILVGAGVVIGILIFAFRKPSPSPARTRTGSMATDLSPDEISKMLRENTRRATPNPARPSPKPRQDLRDSP